ncbi:hypothetical protein [Gluconacetobacter diazotrophicus]|uniref:hypothetical protein n=1 Tax=Gluconacetobacter diazotrophicus TaxID=33996 RepID=UPI00119BE1BB|nr:hypothetical protein [Gluconacetobacter diazotrophicus]TWA98114.1 hypothetical protein FBZ86_1583 [Gluconacetobacter diazotrophicus]
MSTTNDESVFNLFGEFEKIPFSGASNKSSELSKKEMFVKEIEAQINYISQIKSDFESYGFKVAEEKWISSEKLKIEHENEKRIKKNPKATPKEINKVKTPFWFKPDADGFATIFKFKSKAIPLDSRIEEKDFKKHIHVVKNLNELKEFYQKIANFASEGKFDSYLDKYGRKPGGGRTKKTDHASKAPEAETPSEEVKSTKGNVRQTLKTNKS